MPRLLRAEVAVEVGQKHLQGSCLQVSAFRTLSQATLGEFAVHEHTPSGSWRCFARWFPVALYSVKQATQVSARGIPQSESPQLRIGVKRRG